jgi:type III secretory pathway component EscV
MTSPQRIEILRRVVRLDGPISELNALLETLPWDASEHGVEISADDVKDILKNYLAGKLSSADVEAWANLIECREDFSMTPAVLQLVFVLANPVLEGKLTPELANNLIQAQPQ